LCARFEKSSVVRRLKPTNGLDRIMSQRIEKPWGYEIIWAKTDKYVGKILHINAGHKLSRQYHNIKDETFLVQSGKMRLEITDTTNQTSGREMSVGDQFHCPAKTIHRMIAVEDTDVIEVSTPELDDVVRVEDDYGRGK
jgi:mannose-6-phosphate isomerase